MEQAKEIIFVSKTTKRKAQQDIMILNEQIDQLKSCEIPNWKQIAFLIELRDVKIDHIKQIEKKRAG